MSDLRSFAKRFFKALSPCVTSDYSEIVCTQFQRQYSQLFPNSLQFVALYEPMVGEIEVTLLKDFFELKGAKCFFPRWKDLGPGEMEFGIDPEALNLILVPGLAFGERGERMGRGQGYYDRFLPRATHTLKIALTYDELVKPSLKQESWDVPMDYIFTQTRVIDCKSKRG
ncbi:MAG: hypothetical protein KA715_11695 [Xanthomonadaceae bacterium]|nr:hypothetical protein [Xanthomonadaceae bacterium]